MPLPTMSKAAHTEDIIVDAARTNNVVICMQLLTWDLTYVVSLVRNESKSIILFESVSYVSQIPSRYMTLPYRLNLRKSGSGDNG